ncbi:MAG TPA: helix-turn-helix domain-containing protein [Solimonas sp.]
MSAVAAMQVYVWDRRFLLCAQSFMLPRAARPHRRLSATVLMARARPFAMEGIGTPGQRYQGVILAPNVPRLSLEAEGSELTLLDAGVGTAAYYRLQPMLRPGGVRALGVDELSRVHAVPAPSPDMDAAAASLHYEQVLAALVGDALPSPQADARVARACALIDEQPMDVLSMTQLAAAVGVSPSRLRALFQRELGCAPAQYARWASAWKAIRRWRKGARLTDLAMDAGFHDLPHIHRSIKALFGMNPSSIAQARDVRLLQCGD